MANRFHVIAKFNPSYFGFLSGISISIATNIITDIKASPDMDCFLKNDLIISAISFFVSGIVIVILSWILEEPYLKWRSADRDIGYSDEKLLSVAIQGKLIQSWSCFIVGLGLFIFGSVTLFF